MRNGAPVSLEAPLLRRLLAVLLCQTPRPVSAAEAIDALWGSAPPPTAPKTLQVYVHRLRRAVGEDRIEHGAAGYVIHASADELDALRFAELVDHGRTAYRQSHLERASELLDEALRLWRAAAYADIAAGGLVAQEAARLEEQRILAAEELAAVELERGRYPDVIPRLTDLVASHPYRENLCGQLMVALYHSGRQAEALQVYRATWVKLVEDLAVEPTPQLQRLHETILRGDLPPPTPRHASTAPAPRQLPRDVWAFTGRSDALRVLDAALSGDGTPGVVVISAISGMAGVGKTALAVHWAHGLRDRFLDGQLYVNLRGYESDRPLLPIEAVALLLRALGVTPAQVPVDLDAAVGLYRSVLAGRRILVLLDNARDAEQVRPLLPGEPGCLVLVTSRDRLTGLVARDGARRLMLDPLTPADSHALLSRLLGDVECEASTIGDLAVACGHLPRALCIAAAHLTDQPDADVAGYVEELRGDHALARLEIDGDPASSARAPFQLSYLAHTGAARRLGLIPGPDVTVPAAAAVADVDAADAARLLDTLARAHLITLT